MKLLWSDDAPVTRGAEWLVPDVIPRRGIGFLVGASGSGKTFLSVHLGACVGFGTAFFGVRPGAHAETLIVAAEGADGLGARVGAAAGGLGFRAMIARGPVDLGSECSRGRFADAVTLAAVERGADAPKLVVLDTFSRVFQLDDENSARDTQRATEAMRHLSERLGAFVLAVHHPGKDRRAGMRGSSLLRAEADTVIEIRPRGVVYLSKSRESEDGYSLGRFTLAPIENGDRPTCFVRETGGRGADHLGSPAPDRTSRGSRLLREICAGQERGLMGFSVDDFTADFHRRYGGNADACRKALARALKDVNMRIDNSGGAKRFAINHGRTGH